MSAVIALVLGIAVTSADCEPIWRESPGDFVRRHVDEMLALTRDPAIESQERQVAVRAAVAKAFDFSELSRRALGRHWAKMSGRERTAFLEGVRGIVTEAYVGRIARHLGDHAQVVRGHIRLLDESVTGDRANVVLAVRYGGQDIPVDAILSRYRTTWRICDLAIHGVKISENMTAQITRLARDGAYGEMLARLADRRATLAATRATLAAPRAR